MIKNIPRIGTRLLLSLAVLFCGTLTRILADSETPIMEETFELDGPLEGNFKPDSAAQWTVKDGVLITERGGNASSSVELEPNCVVEADVSFEPDPEKAEEGAGGFAGIILGGGDSARCLFVIQEKGFWFIYKEADRKESLGGLKKEDIEYGKMYHFRVTRQVLDDGYAFQWEVDGEVVGEFTQVNPPAGGDPSKLALVAWRAKGQFDNIRVYNSESE